jgi:threonine dehydratase
MTTPDKRDLIAASDIVYQYMMPSAQLLWPLLNERCGCEVVVKHENHNPTGAFKVRGGLVYVHNLRTIEPHATGIVTATRGNHGQSVAYAASRHGLSSTIVVPEGNNPEKNLAIQALGAELVVHGKDFDEAIPHTELLSKKYGLHRMPSFHHDLVAGVGTYAMELLSGHPDLKRVYVPIGLGSGICGMICARNALQLNTEIVGVVSVNADSYARSFAAGHVVETATANTLADGIAVRVPSPEALSLIAANVSRIVAVTDDEVLEAIKIYFSDTHNLAEGAGAAPLAALLSEKELNRGEKIGLVLSGGNINRELYLRALNS